VAGAVGGRRLIAPRGRSTRPTSERAREGLFSALESLRGPLTGVRFLDLYAGTGAVGIEALSRGAAQATFVESDPTAVEVIRKNLAALDLAGGLVRLDRVERVASGAPDVPYDVVFADPPYSEETGRVSANLVALATNGWLSDAAMVVVERATRDPAWTWPAPIEALRSRRYGEATLWYGHKS
jgi:16S rRNA (guanine966-N2)-methyltransferase